MKHSSREPLDTAALLAEEAELAALFRAAGPPDRVADEELAPIKAQAREAWRRQVRKCPR